MKNRIKELRKEYGMTQVELAKKLDLSVRMVQYWEKNSANNTERDISTNDLDKLAQLFDCTIDYLLYRSDIKKGLSKQNNHSVTINNVDLWDHPIMKDATIQLAKEIEELDLTPERAIEILKIYVKSMKEAQERLEKKKD